MAGRQRWLHAALTALLAAALMCLAAPARAGDPYLRWYTIETPHFRVHFHGGLEAAAQHTANLAESVHARLVPQLGWTPSDVVHILLADSQDSANGSAQVLPYNVIRMYMTAPDDMHVLGDHDDWLLGLFTHEHVHILHLDNISGIPAVINAILGKTLAPNQLQPKWIIEGLAVALESEHTSGGRLRSTLFDMYLRADVLEDNIAGLDEFSHSPRRWPSGNLWYLYGGKFVGWISSIYGPDTFAAVAADYGQNPLAWGVNRSIRRVTGRTYEQLYDGWVKHLRQHYATQARTVRRRGLREGTRLTFGGRQASYPRLVPKCARRGQEPELLYYRSDGHTPGGLYRVRLSAPDQALGQPELVARASGSTATFDDDCGIVFDSVVPTRRRYSFHDLVRLPRGKRSTLGTERFRRRLTSSRRARYPDISPDGSRIAYVTNHAGTSTLRIAELDADHRLANERRLVPSARYEQAFTPRFSPDGQHVAYSVWTQGGYRDIRVVDVDTGQFVQLMHDRPFDQQPSWTPDGRTLLFSSDRTGISNIYAYDLQRRELFQVTNVLGGAFMPLVSADGRTLFYVGYRSSGFDLFSMPLARSRWLPAQPVTDPRPDPPPQRAARRWPVRSYSPWTTLRPHSYALEYGPGTWGQTLVVTTEGADVARLHSFALSLAIEAEQGEPGVSFSYSYHRLPFSVGVRAYRRAVPRSNYRYSDAEPIITEHITGLTTALSYPIPGEYDRQTLTMNYTAAHFDAELPLGVQADPYALLPREPHRGFYGGVRLGYQYDSSSRTHWAISRDRGVRLGVTTDYAGPATGSEWTLTAFAGRIQGYVPLPWADHHVLAVALSGAIADGTYPRRGLYYAGGFTDAPVVESFQTGLTQSGFVLRGYEPAQYVGRQYQLLNVEYRLPLVNVDRGVSTLPVFLNHISAAAFMDYGGAFDDMDLEAPLDSYQLGVGAELWIQLTLGYYAGGTIRIGHARGTDSDASRSGQTYMTIASQF